MRSTRSCTPWETYTRGLPAGAIRAHGSGSRVTHELHIKRRMKVACKRGGVLLRLASSRAVLLHTAAPGQEQVGVLAIADSCPACAPLLRLALKQHTFVARRPHEAGAEGCRHGGCTEVSCESGRAGW